MPTIQLPPLHEAQLECRRGSKRFDVLCCGRRFGKTRYAGTRAYHKAGNGGQVFWIAPPDAIDTGWRIVYDWARQIGAPIDKTMQRISLGRGSIRLRSWDSRAGLRSDANDLLIVDEAAHIPGIKDIWEQELRPTLTDRKGDALFISTPKGHNFFRDLFNKAATDPEWAAFQMPSQRNPFLDPAEIEAARLDLPQLVFRQEYLAEFVQMAGAMFKREYFEIVDAAPELVKQARHWDLAASVKTQADKSAGVRLGITADGTIYILDCIADRWEWPALVKVIGNTAKADGPNVQQSVETTGTQRGMLDLLNADPSLAGVGFRGVSPSTDKITRANPWLARAEQGKVKLVRGAWNGPWLDEVCSFPESDHDDMVDATSGAVAQLAIQPLTIMSATDDGERGFSTRMPEERIFNVSHHDD
jgi:predicted phage terminase large subunit-like protein